MTDATLQELFDFYDNVTPRDYELWMRGATLTELVQIGEFCDKYHYTWHKQILIDEMNRQANNN